MTRHWNVPSADIRESLNRALEVWEAAFDAIVQKSADGVIVVDHSGTICFANSAAESMLRGSGGCLMGKSFGIPVVPNKTTEIDLLKTGGPTRIAEMNTVETSWQGHSAFLCTLRDVTERKRAEEQAREAVRRRDEFLAILSHELRNPLAAISNAATVLGCSDLDGEVFDKARGVIERQCGQMSRLLEDLLDVSRVARRKIELRKECLDLSHVITEAVDATRSMIDDAGQTLSVRLAPTPLSVDADPVRLQQILVNLLSNASKYSKTADRIELSVEAAGEEVTIRVRDQGVGLSADMLDAVFEPFVQLESSLDRSDEGLGLGLAIVHGLVRLHGGTVQASSAGRGLGSEFVVRLPLSKSWPKNRSIAPSAEPGRPLRILIIEDNQDLRAMLKTLLERCGHDVEVAEDGVQGSEMIEFQRPDLALVDIGLPRLDGYELARRIRAHEDCRDVVLIALTGYSQWGDQAKSLASGFDAHLAKPVEFSQLRQMLRDIAETKQARNRV